MFHPCLGLYARNGLDLKEEFGRGEDDLSDASGGGIPGVQEILVEDLVHQGDALPVGQEAVAVQDHVHAGAAGSQRVLEALKAAANLLFRRGGMVPPVPAAQQQAAEEVRRKESSRCPADEGRTQQSHQDRPEHRGAHQRLPGDGFGVPYAPQGACIGGCAGAG